jgi:hypothetical protein
MGIMEEGNIGMIGSPKREFLNPLSQYSNLLPLRLLLPLRSSSGLHARRIERQRRVQVHKLIFVFVFTKKNLCGLGVLCG